MNELQADELQKEEDRIKSFIEKEHKVLDDKLQTLKSQLDQIETHLQKKE